MKRITYQISRPSAFSQIMVPSHDTVKWLEKGCRERASCASRREIRLDIPYQADLHFIKNLTLTEDKYYHHQGKKTYQHLRRVARNIRMETTGYRL